MRRLLLMISAFFLLIANSMAVDYQSYRPKEAAMQGYDKDALDAQAPVFQFSGTSAMQTGSYTVPVAALRADVSRDEPNDPTTPSGPRRIGGRPDYDESDPEQYPIGDAPWALMAIMMALYAVLRVRKSKAVK